MDTIEVEREVFDALIERVDYLHKTVKALYDELRDKRLGSSRKHGAYVKLGN